jgi:hypothetical protein
MAVEVSFLTVRGSAVMRRSRCAEAVPGIENCLACHGAERVDLRAESTCLTCHRFHQSTFGPMRAVKATAW